jgi:chemotaxis signal transduction protein
VIRRDDVSTALAVDAIEDIIEVAEDDIAAPLPLLDRAVADAVAGSFETPEGPVALLSPGPLLEPFGSER